MKDDGNVTSRGLRKVSCHVIVASSFLVGSLSAFPPFPGMLRKSDR